MRHVEFFFDLSSPWTRLAFHNVKPILQETSATVCWRPFLVGGVFNAVNQSVYFGRENPDGPKVRHSFRWLSEWAKLSGVAMRFPSELHPLRSVLPMRVCCVLEDDQNTLMKFADRAFEAYFAEVRNLDDPRVLISIADELGLDGSDLVEKAGTQFYKDRLRKNTEEAIQRGSFGSPTMFVDNKTLYFGNDQLPLLRVALTE